MLQYLVEKNGCLTFSIDLPSITRKNNLYRFFILIYLSPFRYWHSLNSQRIKISYDIKYIIIIIEVH